MRPDIGDTPVKRSNPLRVILQTLLVLVISVAILSSCAPRGETKSIDQIFDIAKTRYEQAIVASKSGEVVRTQLAGVVREFKPFLESSAETEVKQTATQISGELQKLLGMTGYTTRPALGELIKSYRGVSLPDQRETATAVSEYTPTNESWKLDQAAKKLLVSRTYTALAQELETTSFRVVPKGAK